MKKKASPRKRSQDRDTMRPEYDFSAAVAGTLPRFDMLRRANVNDPSFDEALSPRPHPSVLIRRLRQRQTWPGSQRS